MSYKPCFEIKATVFLSASCIEGYSSSSSSRITAAYSVTSAATASVIHADIIITIIIII